MSAYFHIHIMEGITEEDVAAFRKLVEKEYVA